MAYEAFLDPGLEGYLVGIVDDELVGAFGMHDAEGYYLLWILIDPAAQGRGVGLATMTRVLEIGDGRAISIAASHKSAPFFARFGARVVEETPDDWGTGWTWSCSRSSISRLRDELTQVSPPALLADIARASRL